MPQISDGQAFLLILAAFYLWECIQWVQPGSLGFFRRLGRWYLKPARDALYGRKKSILFNPWPDWFCPALVVRELPFGLSEKDLITEEGVKIAWGDLVLEQQQSEVVLIQNRRLRFNSPEEARSILGLLTELKAINPGLRRRRITRFYRLYLSPLRSKRWIRRVLGITDLLRFNGFFLTLYVFLGIPYAYLTQQQSLGFAFALLAAILLLIFQGFVAYTTAKRLFRGRGKQHLAFAFGCLFPWQAMRAGQSLLSKSLATQHPLAVAAALLNQRAFQDYLSAYWRRFTYLSSPSKDDAMRSALESFLKQTGSEEKTLLKPPKKDSQDTVAYCPCCHAQYRESLASCADCKGVELVPFGS